MFTGNETPQPDKKNQGWRNRFHPFHSSIGLRRSQIGRSLSARIYLVLLPINFTAVSDFEHDDGDVPILNLRDQAIIADPIAPEACQVAHEGFA